MKRKTGTVGNNAVAILEKLGWESDPLGFPAGDDTVKPLLTHGEWKAVVGPTWVTAYRVPHAGKTEGMESVKAADADGVRRLGSLAGGRP